MKQKHPVLLELNYDFENGEQREDALLYLDFKKAIKHAKNLSSRHLSNRELTKDDFEGSGDFLEIKEDSNGYTFECHRDCPKNSYSLSVSYKPYQDGENDELESCSEETTPVPVIVKIENELHESEREIEYFLYRNMSIAIADAIHIINQYLNKQGRPDCIYTGKEYFLDTEQEVKQHIFDTYFCDVSDNFKVTVYRKEFQDETKEIDQSSLLQNMKQNLKAQEKEVVCKDVNGSVTAFSNILIDDERKIIIKGF